MSGIKGRIIKERSNRVLKDPLGLEIRFNRHPHRQNNFIVAAMYDLYKQGKTLEDIAKVYRRTRQSIYDLFYSRGYQLRSKQHSEIIEIDGIKFFLDTRKQYFRATIGKSRTMLHLYVWEKYNGKIGADEVVYHKDRDFRNNSVDNLRKIKRDKMSRVFNPAGNNQHTRNNKYIKEYEKIPDNLRRSSLVL